MLVELDINEIKQLDAVSGGAIQIDSLLAALGAGIGAVAGAVGSGSVTGAPGAASGNANGSGVDPLGGILSLVSALAASINIHRG